MFSACGFGGRGIGSTSLGGFIVVSGVLHAGAGVAKGTACGSEV